MIHWLVACGSGFEVEDSACCGPGPVCNSLSFKICEDATKYVFWDSVHPTERTYNILVSDIVKKNIHKFVWKYSPFCTDFVIQLRWVMGVKRGWTCEILIL